MAVKKSFADVGKTLEDLQAEVDTAGYYAGPNFTKAFRRFANLTHRKEAQAHVCASITDGKGRGYRLKHDDPDVRIRVQKTPFNRRRDKKLTNMQSIVMKQKGSTE